MKDEEINLSDLPEIPPEAFARAIVRKGLQPVERKAQITEEEVRESLCNAVKEEGDAQAGLGSRLAARFAGLGLTEGILELRDEQAHPVDLES